MAVLAVLLLLILAAPAGAATVSAGRMKVCEDFDCTTVVKITFTADAGEANDLRIRGEGRSFTFEDPAATVRAGKGCTADGDHRAVCHVDDHVGVLLARISDGDDRADAPALAVVDGGAGNDTLHGGEVGGGEGNDTLSGSGYKRGGPGDDRLVGGGDAGPGDDVVDVSGQPASSARLGPGRDVYLGSPGYDWVYDDGGADPSVDTIDGGGGDEDTISYQDTLGPVVVDLGGPGSTDQLTGFEDARGTEAADTLLGHEGADDLRGESGDDRIEGRGGNDSIDGGPGSDRIDAGTGADRVSGGFDRDFILLGDDDDHVNDDDDFFRDEVDCGAGEDTAKLDREDARIACERPVLLPAPRIVTRIAPAGGGRHRLHYSSCGYMETCRGTSRITVRSGRRTVQLPEVRFGPRRGDPRTRSAPFRLPRALRGRLTLVVTSYPHPGEAAGVLPARDRVRLSRP